MKIKRYGPHLSYREGEPAEAAMREEEKGKYVKLSDVRSIISQNIRKIKIKNGDFVFIKSNDSFSLVAHDIITNQLGQLAKEKKAKIILLGKDVDIQSMSREDLERIIDADY